MVAPDGQLCILSSMPVAIPKTIMKSAAMAPITSAIAAIIKPALRTPMTMSIALPPIPAAPVASV